MPPAIQMPTSIPTMMTIKNVGMQSDTTRNSVLSTSAQGISSRSAITTAIRAAMNTDIVVSTPRLMSATSTATITRKEITAKAGVGVFRVLTVFVLSILVSPF